LEEARVGGGGGGGDGGGGIDRRFTRLIRKKNMEIEESHEELKAKVVEIQNSADELRAKNDELTNSMAVLRLYQLMFESDPNGLIGISSEGLIVQFNSSAIRYFGYDLHKMRMQNIAELKMPHADVDVDLHAVFSEALRSGESARTECRQQNKQVSISCFRLEDIRGERGVVFRFSDVGQ
jgi:PAS domain S-box-containing protein